MLKWSNIFAVLGGSFLTVGFQGIWDGEWLAGALLLAAGVWCVVASFALDK